MADEDKYQTIPYVMDKLACTEKHVRELLAAGLLTGIRIGIGKNGSYGRAIRISERSLSEFIEARKINPEDFFDPENEEEKESYSSAPQPVVARSRWINK